MKSAAFVLASQQVPARKEKKIFGSRGEIEDEYEREWVLCKASDVRSSPMRSKAVVDRLQVVLQDNITMMQYFGRQVLAAPEVSFVLSFHCLKADNYPGIAPRNLLRTSRSETAQRAGSD